MHVDVLILCGGRGSRMGGQDKGLLGYGGRPVAVHLLELIRSQFAELGSCVTLGRCFISANRSLAAYEHIAQQHRATVVPDMREDFAGPLAGIEAALLHSTAPYLLVLPCDVVHLPPDLVERFALCCRDGLSVPVVRASNGADVQPAICMLQTQQREAIVQLLENKQRSLQYWQQDVGVQDVFFHAPFHNLNTPSQWQTALAQCGR